MLKKVSLNVLSWLNHGFSMLVVIAVVYRRVMALENYHFYWNEPYLILAWINVAFLILYIISELLRKFGKWSEEEKESKQYAFFIKSIHICRVCGITCLLIAAYGRLILRAINTRYYR